MAAEAQPLLIDRLRECELIDADQLEALAALPEAQDPDPRALGRVLLQRKLLSKFQVNLAAQGRGKELKVGQYVLLEKLGEGGMGQVFKAKHRIMGRVVALKLIRKEKLANPDSVRRFYQEVESAARLSHPNIVLAYDAGQAGTAHYMAMELVEGSDLARQVKESGPLPVAVACEYARQAAVGLQHAHEQGMVHRDVKPHNLLVGQSGGKTVVKLLDMGLARLSQQGETGLTQSGQVLGTPDYLAPEQAFDSRKADARSDVYSLGCTLYYLLTGSAPFTADTLTQVLLKHQMEEVRPLCERRPDAPPALQAVLRRMVAKSPDDRYQTAAEVAEALEPFSRGEAGEVPSMPPPPPRASRFESSGDTWAGLDDDGGAIAKVPKTSRSATRHEEETPRRKKPARGEDGDATRKYLLIGAAAGVPLLLLLGVGLVFLLTPGSKPPVDKGKGKIVATKDKEKDRDAGKDGEKDAGDKDGGLPPDDDKGGGVKPPPVVPPVGEGPGVPAGDVALADSTRLVGGGFGGELHREVAPAGGLLVGLEVGIGKWGPIDVSQAFRPVFRTGDKETLGRQYGTELTRVVRLVAKAGYAVGAAKVKTGANADGLSLVFMKVKGDALDPADSYESEWVADPRPGPLQNLTGGGKPIVGVVLKANDKHVTGWALILGGGAGGAAPPSSTFEKEIARHDIEPHSILGLSRDGKRLACGHARVLRVLDTEKNTWRTMEMEPLQFALHSRFVGDGHRLLVCATDRRPRLYDTDTGKIVQTFDQHPELANGVDVSPDGALALVACGQGAPGGGFLNTVVCVYDVASGKIVRKFEKHDCIIQSVRFLGDGKRAASVDARQGLRIWNVADATEVKSLPLPPNATNTPPAPSRDGRRLLVTAATALVWLDLETGAKLQEIQAVRPHFFRRSALTNNDRFAVGTTSGTKYEGGRPVRDGGQLVTVENWVRVFDLETGRVVRTFEGHTGQPHDLVISPDGTRAYSASNDRTLRVWDLAGGGKAPPPVAAEERKPMATYATPLAPRMALSPDGKRVIVGGTEGLHLLDTAAAEWTFTAVPRSAKVSALSLALSKDGKNVLVCGRDRSVRLVEIASGNTVRELESGDAFGYDAQVSPDGAVALVVASMQAPGSGPWIEKSVRVYDLATGKVLRKFDKHASGVLGVAFLDGGKRAVSFDADTIRVWNVADASEVRSYPATWPHRFMPTQDGSHVLTQSPKEVNWLNLETGRSVTLRRPEGMAMFGAAAPVDSGRFFLVAGGAGRDDAVIRQYERETGKLVRELKGHAGVASGLLISPDGKRAFSVSHDRALCVWDLSHGGAAKPSEGTKTPPEGTKTPPEAGAAARFKGHVGPVNAVAVSPNGQHLLTGGTDGTLRLWSTETGKELWNKPQGGGGAGCVRVGFAANGSLVYGATADARANVYSTEEGDQLYNYASQREKPLCSVFMPDGATLHMSSRGRMHSHFPKESKSSSMSLLRTSNVRSLAAHPEGRALAVGDDFGVVRLLPPASLTEKAGVAFPTHKGAVLALAYSGKATRIVSGGADKHVVIRDLRTTKVLRRITAHTSAVNAVAFSPNGRWVLTGSDDKTVRLFDASSGREVKRYTDHAEAVTGVAWGPNNKVAYSCGEDVREWDLPPEVAAKATR